MLLESFAVTANFLEIFKTFLKNLLKQFSVQETLLTGWCFSNLQVTQIHLARVQFRFPYNRKKGLNSQEFLKKNYLLPGMLYRST